MKLAFSPALPEDVEAIFQLNQALMDRYEDRTSLDYEKVLLWVRKNIAETLPFFRRILWEGQLAGYFCLTPQGEIDSLFVLPLFQRKGIGTRVLRNCQKQQDALFLYVFQKNTDAICLYEKMGFRITKQVSPTRYIMEYKSQDR